MTNAQKAVRLGALQVAPGVRVGGSEQLPAGHHMEATWRIRFAVPKWL